MQQGRENAKRKLSAGRRLKVLQAQTKAVRPEGREEAEHGGRGVRPAEEGALSSR